MMYVCLLLFRSPFVPNTQPKKRAVIADLFITIGIPVLVFAFLGFFLTLIPIPWHFQAWNAGTCAYMIWVSLACLTDFVNSIIWSGNVYNIAPVWCDISSEFLLGAGVGIPAASLCISRRLYTIASVKTTSITRDDKRRAVIADLFIAVGIPVLAMALHYVVQGHRFDILEDVGCYPVIYNTLLAYPLVFMWPVLLGCVSFVYSAMTLRLFWIRRMQINEFIQLNNSMNTGRYLRLMLLAVMDMMCTIPVGIYSVYIGNLGVGLAPWISWSNVHYNFSRVDLVPSIFWRGDPAFQTSVEMTRWLYPAAALLFFALFGFASEAQKNYKRVFKWIKKCLGFNPSSTEGSSASDVNIMRANPPPSFCTLPMYAVSKSQPARSDSVAYPAGSSIGIDLAKSSRSTLSSTPTAYYHNKDRKSETSSIKTSSTELDGL